MLPSFLSIHDLFQIWRFIYLDGGTWKINEEIMWVPNLAIAKYSYLDPSQVYNLHQYYFFLGISTSGALLFMAKLGLGGVDVNAYE